MKFWETPQPGIVKKADILCMVYDVTEKSSLRTVQTEFSHLQNVLPNHALKYMIGNMEDLTAFHEVTPEDLKGFEKYIDKMFMTSAKYENKDVYDIFCEGAKCIKGKFVNLVMTVIQVKYV